MNKNFWAKLFTRKCLAVGKFHSLCSMQWCFIPKHNIQGKSIISYEQCRNWSYLVGLTWLPILTTLPSISLTYPTFCPHSFSSGSLTATAPFSTARWSIQSQNRLYQHIHEILLHENISVTLWNMKILVWIFETNIFF